VSGLIQDATLLAERVESLDTVMSNDGQIAGYTGGELSLIENRIESLGITTQATRTIMTLFAQNNLDVANATLPKGTLQVTPRQKKGSFEPLARTGDLPESHSCYTVKSSSLEGRRMASGDTGNAKEESS
jgi:hypothetical protein